MTKHVKDPISALDTQIRRSREEVERIDVQLVAVRKKLVNAIIRFVRDWYLSETEAIVLGKPERLEEVGAAKIKKLKDQIRDLQRNAPATVASLVDNDENWWSGDPHSSAFPRYRLLNSRFEHSVRLCMGQVGPFLDELGFIADHLWHERDDRGNCVKDSPYVYSLHFAWPDHIQTLKSRYSELVDQAKKCFTDISHFETDKLNLRATRLWKSA